MKIREIPNISPSRTFLKSTAHLRVRENKGSYIRSILVGIQFIFFIPYEIAVVAIWPLINNVFVELFIAIDSVIFVFSSALSTFLTGFFGYLEATDEPTITEIEKDDFI